MMPCFSKVLFAGVVIVGTLSNFQPQAATGNAKTEVEGVWKLEKGGKGSPTMLMFSGNKFVVTFPDDRKFQGTFTINTNENPSWMDMKFESGTEDRFNGKTALCIYKFDADEFIWCASIPGRKRRPPEFAEVMGDARLLLGTFKKKAE